MASVDKNQAVVDFLMQMPYIQGNPLFFNFINASDNNKQIVTMANDKTLDRQFIDGSVLKRYTFTIVDYKSIAYNPLVNASPYYSDENVEDMLDVQSIIEWVKEQDELRNYPDFGEDCEIDSIEALSEEPNLNGVDTSITPTLAKYSVSIRINYLDTSKVIFNK